MNNTTQVLRTLMAAAALAAGLLGAQVAQAEQKQYLILAKTNGFSGGFEAAIQAAGGLVDHKLSAIGVAAARSADPGFAAKASAIPELEAVVPDLMLQVVGPVTKPSITSAELAAPSPSDDDLSRLQWGLDAIQAREAWEAAALAGNPGARGAGARVAVLDFGIDLTHPDLSPNLNLELSRSLVLGWFGEPLQYEHQPGDPMPFAHGSATGL